MMLCQAVFPDGLGTAPTESCGKAAGQLKHLTSEQLERQ